MWNLQKRLVFKKKNDDNKNNNFFWKESRYWCLTQEVAIVRFAFSNSISFSCRKIIFIFLIFFFLSRGYSIFSLQQNIYGLKFYFYFLYTFPGFSVIEGRMHGGSESSASLFQCRSCVRRFEKDYYFFFLFLGAFLLG